MIMRFLRVSDFFMYERFSTEFLKFFQDFFMKKSKKYGFAESGDIFDIEYAELSTSELRGVASKEISLWPRVFNYSKGSILIHKFPHFDMNYKNKFY